MINNLMGESTYDVTYKIGKEKYSLTTSGRSQKEVRNDILTFCKVSGIKIHDLKIVISREDFKKNLLMYLDNDLNNERSDLYGQY